MNTVIFNNSDAIDPNIAAADAQLVDQVSGYLRSHDMQVEILRTSSFPDLDAALESNTVLLVMSNFPPDLTYTTAGYLKSPELAAGGLAIPGYKTSSHWIAYLTARYPDTDFIAITGAYRAMFEDDDFVPLSKSGNLAIIRKHDISSKQNDLQQALGNTVAEEIQWRLYAGVRGRVDIDIEPHDREPDDIKNIIRSDLGTPELIRQGEIIFDVPDMRYYELVMKENPTGIVFLCPGAGLTHLSKEDHSFSAYRFHEEDPILYQKGLRLTLRCGEEIGNQRHNKRVQRWKAPPTTYTTYVWVYEW